MMLFLLGLLLYVFVDEIQLRIQRDWMCKSAFAGMF